MLLVKEFYTHSYIELVEEDGWRCKSTRCLAGATASDYCVKANHLTYAYIIIIAIIVGTIHYYKITQLP